MGTDFENFMIFVKQFVCALSKPAFACGNTKRRTKITICSWQL